MNTIFKYNANAKYSTKDLRGGYNSNNFSLLDVYLDEKGPSVKIQLPNIFKYHHIVGKPSPATVGYDEWSLSKSNFHVRLILYDLGISSPHKNGFSKVKNAYIKSAYYSICDGYGVDADETWMHGDWFHTTGYDIFGHEVKATKTLDSLTRWII